MNGTHSGRRWAAAIIGITFALVLAAWAPLFECPSCLGIAAKAGRDGLYIQDYVSQSAIPLKTGCPTCGDSGRVGGLKRRFAGRIDPSLFEMLQNPPLVGTPKKIDYASMYKRFNTSLKQLVTRSGSKEAQSVIEEFERVSYHGQLEYLQIGDAPYLLCYLMQRGGFSRADWLTALLLFDLDGQVMDVVRIRTSDPYTNSCRFLNDPNDTGAMAEVVIGDEAGKEVQGTIWQGGKDRGFSLTPPQGQHGGSLRIGIKDCKFAVLSEMK